MCLLHLPHCSGAYAYSQVNCSYVAQYHKSQIYLTGLYRIQHPLSLDPSFGQGKKPPKKLLMGKKWKDIMRLSP